MVGEQPLLHPNESFEYPSGTPSQRRSARCAAEVTRVADDGTHFDAPIPEFPWPCRAAALVDRMPAPHDVQCFATCSRRYAVLALAVVGWELPSSVAAQ